MPEQILVTGETFKESFEIKEDIKSEPTINFVQECFLLSEADFIYLKKGKSKFFVAALTVFLTSLVFIIPLLSKYISYRIDPKSVIIQSWEWFAPLIAIFLSLVLYLLGTLLPNEYKDVIKAIEEHYRKAPKKRIIEKR